MSQAIRATRTLEDLPGPRAWPLLGNFPQIDFDEFHLQLERWAERYGSAYRMSLGPNRFIVVSDLEAAGMLLRERPELFSRRGALEHIFAELGFNGVFSADGDNWRRQRRIVITALNSSHLHEFYASMLETTGRLRRRWQQLADRGEVVDLCAELMRYTVDITTQLAFGIDFNTLETEGPVIRQHLDKVFPMLNRRLGMPFPYWRHVKLPADRALDRAVAAVHARIRDVIANCRARITDEPSRLDAPTNFLEAMIAAKETEQLPFSDDDIIANVFTLLLAGEDTTANTLAWAIKFMIDYPDLFAQARGEVDAVLGAALAPPTHEHAGRLPFLDAFMNETMRLKPVAPLQVMEAKQDVDVAGVALRAGTCIVLLQRRIATDAAHFHQPSEFRVERWLERERPADRAHNPKAFMPFGGGPRFCPGRNLALLEIRVVLAMLCRNFQVELANGGLPVEEHFAFTMAPGKLRVRFRARA